MIKDLQENLLNSSLTCIYVPKFTSHKNFPCTVYSIIFMPVNTYISTNFILAVNIDVFVVDQFSHNTNITKFGCLP